jgi:hypothetical protein
MLGNRIRANSIRKFGRPVALARANLGPYRGGCFDLNGSRGRLGVLTKSDDQFAQFRSVEENFAIIETENTDDRYNKAASTIDHHLHIDEDDSSMDSDVIPYESGRQIQRLLFAEISFSMKLIFLNCFLPVLESSYCFSVHNSMQVGFSNKFVVNPIKVETTRWRGISEKVRAKNHWHGTSKQNTDNIPNTNCIPTASNVSIFCQYHFVHFVREPPNLP